MDERVKPIYNASFLKIPIYVWTRPKRKKKGNLMIRSLVGRKEGERAAPSELADDLRLGEGFLGGGEAAVKGGVENVVQ